MLSIAIAGGIWVAHDHSALRSKLPSLSLKIQKHAVKSDDWKKNLDLSQGERRENTLVQKLKNQTEVVYTLDPTLQKQTRALFTRYEIPYAALVAIDLEKNEVITMVGYSAADENLSDRHLCLTPWAPSASIFKLVTASALLEQGVSAEKNVCYHGGRRRLSLKHLQDHPKWDTSCRTLSEAIARSTNPIIAKLADRHLSRNNLLNWAKHYGFNQAIPLALPVVPSRAQIPSDRLARAQTAAGFWRVDMSALHGALIASVPARQGFMRWPRLVRKVHFANGKKLIPPNPKATRIMKRSTAKDLAKMMLKTTSPIGTGRRGFISRRGTPYLENFAVAGKTGSLSRTHPALSYSWFVGYGPYENPKVAFAVLLANPPKWRIKASTAARMYLEYYLKR